MSGINTIFQHHRQAYPEWSSKLFLLVARLAMRRTMWLENSPTSTSTSREGQPRVAVGEGVETALQFWP